MTMQGQGREGRRAPRPGDQVDFAEPEDFWNVNSYIIQHATNPGYNNTDMMIGLLSRDDLRGRTAQMYAKDRLFGFWLRNFYEDLTAKKLVNSTEGQIIRYFLATVDWRAVCAALIKVYDSYRMGKK